MIDVAFSDELPARLNTTYNLQNQGVRGYSEDQPVAFTFKDKSITFHIWASISRRGSSDLYFMDGKKRIDSKAYCKILKFAKKQMEKLNVKYLMEDGAKCHSCDNSAKFRKEKNIKVFLKLNAKRDGKYFQSGNSADLNPISKRMGNVKN